MIRTVSTLLCAALVTVAVGCGAEEPESNPTPRPQLTKLEARTAMEDFYENIEDRSFAAAWGSLSVSARTLIGDFSDWVLGHENRTASQVTGIYVDRLNRLDSLAHVDLRTVDEDRCGVESVQYFSGTWKVQEKENRTVITDPAMQFVRGDDPAQAVSECAEKKQEERLAKREAKVRARERRLAAVEASNDRYDDSYGNSYGNGSSYDDGVDPTPEALDGSSSSEFEQDDIDRANDASEEVQDYCSGAVSEAQYVGCLSHVDEWDIP